MIRLALAFGLLALVPAQASAAAFEGTPRISSANASYSAKSCADVSTESGCLRVIVSAQAETARGTITGNGTTQRLSLKRIGGAREGVSAFSVTKAMTLALGKSYTLTAYACNINQDCVTTTKTFKTPATDTPSTGTGPVSIKSVTAAYLASPCGANSGGENCLMVVIDARYGASATVQISGNGVSFNVPMTRVAFDKNTGASIFRAKMPVDLTVGKTYTANTTVTGSSGATASKTTTFVAH